MIEVLFFARHLKYFRVLNSSFSLLFPKSTKSPPASKKSSKSILKHSVVYTLFLISILNIVVCWRWQKSFMRDRACCYGVVIIMESSEKRAEVWIFKQLLRFLFIIIQSLSLQPWSDMMTLHPLITCLHKMKRRWVESLVRRVAIILHSKVRKKTFIEDILMRSFCEKFSLFHLEYYKRNISTQKKKEWKGKRTDFNDICENITKKRRKKKRWKILPFRNIFNFLINFLI